MCNNLCGQNEVRTHAVARCNLSYLNSSFCLFPAAFGGPANLQSGAEFFLIHIKDLV